MVVGTIFFESEKTNLFNHRGFFQTFFKGGCAMSSFRATIVSALILTLGATVTCRAVELPELSGDLKLNFAEIRDGGGTLTGYRFQGISSSLEFDLNVPVEVPISIKADHLNQPIFWSDFTAWDNPLLALNPTCKVVSLVGDIATDQIPIKGSLDLYDALRNLGPTEQTSTIIPIDLTPDGPVSLFGVPATFSFNAGLMLKYNVTLPAGANVAIDQKAVLEKLTIEQGATLIGDPNMIIRTDLINNGYFGNLSGKIQGDFKNTGWPQNATAVVTGDLTINGQLDNTGRIDLETGTLQLTASATQNRGKFVHWNGSLNYADTFANSGEYELHAGSIYGTGEFSNTGAFRWSGGTLPQQFANKGLMTLEKSSLLYINTNGVINNSGTMVQFADVNLCFAGWTAGTWGGFRQDAVLNNLADGVYEIQGDGNMSQLSWNHYGTINNAGLFRKSAGIGESVIDGSISFNNNSGTVVALSGTLSINGAGSSTNGTFSFGNGGRLRLGNQVGSAPTFSLEGQQTLYGPGVLELSGSVVTVSAGKSATIISQEANMELTNGYLYVEDGATLNLNLTQSGRIKFMGGTLTGSGTIENCGTMDWTGGTIYMTPGIGLFVNAVQMTISGTGSLSFQRGTISNAGTITHIGNAILRFDGWNGDHPILKNQAGGVYDLQGDGVLTSLDARYRGVFENAGLFRKSAGTGESIIGDTVTFDNTGTLEVASGTLTVNGPFTQTAGKISLHGGKLKSASVLNIQGGSIEGCGILEASLANNGTISPGIAAGTMSIIGNLSQLDGSSMLFEIGGPISGTDHDLLNVSGMAVLNGSLSLDLLNSYENLIATSQTFVILDAGSPLTGSFMNVASGQRLITADGLGSFQVDYGAESPYGSDKITLSNFQAVPEPSTLALAICSLCLGICLIYRRTQIIRIG